MVNVSVARRYAKGLLEAAGAQADEVLGQLESLVAYLEQNEAIFAALCSPALPRSNRMAVTEAVINASAGMKLPLANLLRLLTDRNRFAVLPPMTRLFRLQVDARVGRVRGTVTTATKLAEPQVQAIRAQLEAMTQKKVVLDAAVDASLLGGVVAQVGSQRYDGSLRNQLNEMAQKLGAR